MKKIDAIIKPFKLNEVIDALAKIDIQGVTITYVEGFGRQKGHLEIYRGSEIRVKVVPKIKIELVVEDKMEDVVVKTISEAAKTGEVGDGKIFTYDINNAVRIRTGEKGNAAI